MLECADGWKKRPDGCATGARRREECARTPRVIVVDERMTHENNVSLHSVKRRPTPGESSERATAEDSERRLTRSSFE